MEISAEGGTGPIGSVGGEDYALMSLMVMVNLLAAGHSPHEVIPHLCGASLLACKKMSGGFRPTAVGEVLQWLTAHMLPSLQHLKSSSISN